MPWESPELWQGQEPGPRTFKSDIWAFGCVALEVSRIASSTLIVLQSALHQVQMGMKPWDPEHEGNRDKSRRLQWRSKGGYPANKSDLKLGGNHVLAQVWDLMEKCWQKEPKHRPAASVLRGQLEGMSTQVS